MSDAIDEELVKQLFLAMLEPDIETLEQRFSTDFQGYGRGVKSDRQGVLAGVRQSREQYELVDCEFHEIVLTDSTATVFATAEFRLQEEIMGTDPSEETYVTPGAMLFEFDEGEITKIRQVANREPYLSYLGLLSDTVTGGGLTDDLTADKLRLQYREVLSRVLRHNIRNKTSVILGIAEELMTDESTATIGEQLRDTGEQLASVATKAREVEQDVLSESVIRDDVEVYDLCESVIDDHELSETAEWSIQVSTTETLRTDSELLESALTELVENAFEHSSQSQPRVEISIDSLRTEQYDIEIAITDAGPGIPEHELTPLREGEETDLMHTSSVGLWRVKWCVARLDGDVTFETPESGGTRVRIRLPNLTPESEWSET